MGPSRSRSLSSEAPHLFFAHVAQDRFCDALVLRMQCLRYRCVQYLTSRSAHAVACLIITDLPHLSSRTTSARRFIDYTAPYPPSTPFDSTKLRQLEKLSCPVQTCQDPIFTVITLQSSAPTAGGRPRIHAHICYHTSATLL